MRAARYLATEKTYSPLIDLKISSRLAKENDAPRSAAGEAARHVNWGVDTA